MSGSDCGKLERACLLQSRQPPAVLPYGKSDHMCQISQLLEQYPELKVFCENSPFFRMLAEFFFFLNITRQTKQVRPRVDCQSTTCSNIHIGKLYLLIFRSLESTYRWIKAQKTQWQLHNKHVIALNNTAVKAETTEIGKQKAAGVRALTPSSPRAGNKETLLLMKKNCDSEYLTYQVNQIEEL